MPLEHLVKANQEFLRNSASPFSKSSLDDILPATDKSLCHWAVVTCMSGRLVDFIHKALGFKRGDAIFIQNAGNTITPYDNSIIRSLAVGIYTLGVKEVAVVGHTHCGMKMDVAPLTDAFAKYGKSREILKDMDVREWFGLITNEEINIRKVVDAIRQSPVIPQEIPVYGLLINTHTGELKEVYRHQETAKTATGEIPTANLAQDTAPKTPDVPKQPPVMKPKPEAPKVSQYGDIPIPPPKSRAGEGFRKLEERSREQIIEAARERLKSKYK